MAGIPTEYAGIRFRSRLEATWAAFFDLLNWPWEYEPLDLAGYIPDFVIRGCSPLLVEVKPYVDILGSESAAKKIVRSGWSGEYSVVGTSLLTRGDFDPEEEETFKHVPILGCRWDFDISYPFETDLIFCSGCRRFHWICGPVCGLCGYRWEPGDRRGDDGILSASWATAKNRTQWRGEFGA